MGFGGPFMKDAEAEEFHVDVEVAVVSVTRQI